MSRDLPASDFRVTLNTMAFGAIGAALGWAVSAPIYILTGPAVAVSIVSMLGVRTTIHPGLRDACFVVLGVAVGSGFDADAAAAMVRWPLAFVFMALLIAATLLLSQWVLSRFLGFDRRAALLTAAPGHLSFVIAMASEMKEDVARISMAQSVRLLALTLLVPVFALALGLDVVGLVMPAGSPMSIMNLTLLLAAGFATGLVLKRLSFPAPLLLGAMMVSGAGHLSGLTPGILPAWLLLPAYMVLGILIGTRFSGADLKTLRSGLAVGVVVTFIAAAFAALGALPVAWALEMPVAHVLVAFAPGGLETMIAMGIILGVVPGFVAACHIARLLVLTVLLPALLAHATGAQSEK
jgi:membrane AbrB-like protein